MSPSCSSPIISAPLGPRMDFLQPPRHELPLSRTVVHVCSRGLAVQRRTMAAGLSISRRSHTNFTTLVIALFFMSTGCDSSRSTTTPSPRSRPAPIPTTPSTPPEPTPPELDVLAAPVGLEFAEFSYRRGAIAFSWSAVRSATHYEVEYGETRVSLPGITRLTLPFNQETAPLQVRVRAWATSPGEWSAYVTGPDWDPPQISWEVEGNGIDTVNVEHSLLVSGEHTYRDHVFEIGEWRAQIGFWVTVHANDSHGFLLLDDLQVDLSDIPQSWSSTYFDIDFDVDDYTDQTQPSCRQEESKYIWTQSSAPDVFFSFGGYGRVTISGRIAELPERVELVLNFPGQNASSLLDLRGAHRALWGSRRTHSFRGCTLQREKALQFGGTLWQDWDLPIPVDVVDNFPRVSAGDIMDQVRIYSDSIEEYTGIRILDPGQIISLTEHSWDRSNRLQRFHIGYQLEPCGVQAYACAFVGSGFASWASDDGTYWREELSYGPISAVPHELEHLLGFEHPADWDSQPGQGIGVSMVTPRVETILPGQQCWGSFFTNAGDYHYFDYDWNLTSGPDTMENLRCIFGDHAPRAHTRLMRNRSTASRRISCGAEEMQRAHSGILMGAPDDSGGQSFDVLKEGRPETRRHRVGGSPTSPKRLSGRRTEP